MKKINHELIMGIIWVVLACVFFCNDKIWVALPWFFVGIIKLEQGIHANQTSKKSQDISSVLTETANTQDEEKDYIRHTAVIETIELSKEVHMHRMMNMVKRVRFLILQYKRAMKCIVR